MITFKGWPIAETKPLKGFSSLILSLEINFKVCLLKKISRDLNKGFTTEYHNFNVTSIGKKSLATPMLIY